MFANFDFTVDLTNQTLFRRLAQIGLDRDHFAIFGSAPLFVRGIIPDIQDLDIVARSPAWDKAAELGVPMSGTLSSDPIIHFWGGRIEIFREWLPPSFDTDDLIDEAQEYGGFRFVKPECVVTYKSILNRPKDIVHLEILRDLLQVDQFLSR
jgi:hypothetical protein